MPARILSSPLLSFLQLLLVSSETAFFYKPQRKPLFLRRGGGFACQRKKWEAGDFFLAWAFDWRWVPELLVGDEG